MTGSRYPRGAFAATLAAAALCIAATGGSALAAPPACGHADVVGVLKDAFNSVQEYDLKSKRRLAGVDAINDLGVVEHAPVLNEKFDVSRYCQGQAKLNDGEGLQVWFRIYAKRADADGEFGGVRPCFAKYNPPPITDCSKDPALKKP